MHVLPFADEIVHMDNGRIVERGSFEELISRGEAFARLVEEFGVAERKDRNLDTSVDETIEHTAVSETNAKPSEITKRFAGDERISGAVSGCACTMFPLTTITEKTQVYIRVVPTCCWRALLGVYSHSWAGLGTSYNYHQHRCSWILDGELDFALLQWRLHGPLRVSKAEFD